LIALTVAIFLLANVKEVQSAGLGDLKNFFFPKKEVVASIPVKVVKTFESETHRLALKYNVDEELSFKIMYCESRHYTRVENKNYDKSGVWWSSDWGRWQVNDYYHEAAAIKLGLNIYDEWDNLEYGFILLSKQGTQPWNASKACWGGTETLEQLKLKYK
jgi:hypothetical protein